jgi:hypothetical protein
MSKRQHFSIKSMEDKRAKLDARVGPSHHQSHASANPFLAKPVKPDVALATFLLEVRTAALNYLPTSQRHLPITKPYCEVEARLGVLHTGGQRVTSSGAKSIHGHAVQAFHCTARQLNMLSGVSRTHFAKTTGAGLGEVSPLSRALGVTAPEYLKRDIIETVTVETVYTGYANDGRACFDGEHPPPAHSKKPPVIGKLESREKLTALKMTLPAANFDLRANLSSEKIMDAALTQPRDGWKSKRIKRQRSYRRRRSRLITWQIDITEVTTVEEK